MEEELKYWTKEMIYQRVKRHFNLAVLTDQLPWDNLKADPYTSGTPTRFYAYFQTPKWKWVYLGEPCKAMRDLNAKIQRQFRKQIASTNFLVVEVDRSNIISIWYRLPQWGHMYANSFHTNLSQTYHTGSWLDLSTFKWTAGKKGYRFRPALSVQQREAVALDAELMKMKLAKPQLEPLDDHF